jgi:transcription initiation factor TFIID subunit 2
VDHEVRWCVLKLADILIRGVEETAPKVTIHLPPTPVAETIPQLPPVKLSKPSRQLKSSGPPLKSISSPIPVQPKVKLVPSQSDISVRPNGVASIDPAERFTAPKLHPKGRAPRIVKPVLKAQTRGMTNYDLKACRNALKKLTTHKHAVLFLQPVDPVRDAAPK